MIFPFQFFLFFNYLWHGFCKLYRSNEKCYLCQQLKKFQALRPTFQSFPRSLSASSGIFLGPSYHFDMVRPGYALYGGNPTKNQPNPMNSVINLKARILQCREVTRGETVGYGATFSHSISTTVSHPSSIVTVGVTTINEGGGSNTNLIVSVTPSETGIMTYKSARYLL